MRRGEKTHISLLSSLLLLSRGFPQGAEKKVGVFVHIYPTLQNILKS